MTADDVEHDEDEMLEVNSRVYWPSAVCSKNPSKGVPWMIQSRRCGS